MEQTQRPGGWILAVCHVSHLDPMVVSVESTRSISWMARREFYDIGPMRHFLHHAGAFPVHRQGYARPALREALTRLARGEVVGIFPEGGIKRGTESPLRGGTLRNGTAWLAARSGCPILPVVVLGTEKMIYFRTWFPLTPGKLWIRCGDFITAPRDAHTRAGRTALTQKLGAEFRRIFSEIKTTHQLPDTILP